LTLEPLFSLHQYRLKF